MRNDSRHRYHERVSRGRALAAIFGSFVIAASVANVACGGTTSLGDGEYFPRVARLAADLDTSLRAPTAATPGTNATVVRADEPLRAFADALDRIRPPSDAKDAHHDLTVASKNLAGAAADAPFDLTYVKTPGTITGNAVFVRAWETACHLLQDRASADKIDVDLRCASVLHQPAQGG